jgi:hypothetical protein
MPSTSLAQKKLMAAAAHTPGGYGGVPQSVGKDFHSKDRGKWGALTKIGKKKNDGDGPDREGRSDKDRPVMFGRLGG